VHHPYNAIKLPSFHSVRMASRRPRLAIAAFFVRRLEETTKARASLFDPS
jgi:hypothetical protein